MARTGSKEVKAVFKHFCDACGRDVATKYNDVGAWELDHNGIYGGYVINEISSSGGVNQPFGPVRMKASSFVDAMRFAMRAIDNAK